MRGATMLGNSCSSGLRAIAALAGPMLLGLIGCDTGSEPPPTSRITGVGNPTVTIRVEGVVRSAVDGAALDSIEVVLESFAPSFRRQVRTDSTGAYSLVASVPTPCGPLSLIVSPGNADGWAPQTRTLLCAAQNLRFDWSLQPGF